ncbi:hypothetical protein GF336_03370 [Candidatus Woesearchaeota archaeon]|nr:hypothetical protein [Candidatus Woesearchaeota archaeon]
MEQTDTKQLERIQQRMEYILIDYPVLAKKSPDHIIYEVDRLKEEINNGFNEHTALTYKKLYDSFMEHLKERFKGCPLDEELMNDNSISRMEEIFMPQYSLDEYLDRLSEKDSSVMLKDVELKARLEDYSIGKEYLFGFIPSTYLSFTLSDNNTMEFRKYLNNSRRETADAHISPSAEEIVGKESAFIVTTRKVGSEKMWKFSEKGLKKDLYFFIEAFYDINREKIDITSL